MAEGFKDFAPGDILTAADVDDYLMRQAVMRFADASARTTALSGVLVEGMMSYLKDTNTVEVYDGSAWVGVGGVGAANFTDTATGTYSSGGKNYKYLTFTSSGTITIDTAGLADMLVIAGGAGGAGYGGGGAGGRLSLTDAYLPVGTLTVTVGAGGAGNVYGNDSAVDVYYGIRGGTGSYRNGGSGGGSGGFGASGGAAIANQGNNGGFSAHGTGGGGGGSSTAGGTAASLVAGNGGDGTTDSITGSTVTRCGGGGGGGQQPGGHTAGTGGTGGGGNGSITSATAQAGTANTGGGGGGGGYDGTFGTPGAGGSGLVVVRVEV